MIWVRSRLFLFFLYLCFAIAYYGFSTSGHVVEFHDYVKAYREASGSYAYPKVAQKMTIEHGWPYVFLRQKVCFADVVFPENCQALAPWQVPALWSLWLGGDDSEFVSQHLVFDLIIFLVLMISIQTLVKTLCRIFQSRVFSLQALIGTLCVIGVFFGLLLAFDKCESRQYHQRLKWQAEGVLFKNAVSSVFLSRLIGRANVPDRYTSFTFIGAAELPSGRLKDLTSENWRDVRSFATTKPVVVDAEFIEHVTSNFSLNDLTMFSPKFVTRDVSLLSKIKEITVFAEENEEIKWFTNSVTSKVSLY